MDAVNKTELTTLVNRNITPELNKIIVSKDGKNIFRINLNQDRKGGKPLCSVSLIRDQIKSAKSKRTRNLPKYSEDLKTIFDMSGLFDLEIEFLPSSDYPLDSDNRNYFINGEQISKKMQSVNPLGGWILKLFTNLNTLHFYLVPDTNFIMNRHYSNFFKEVIAEVANSESFKSKGKYIAMYLSRLTILELERQINLKSQEIDGLIKSNKKGKEKNIEELDKEIRIRRQSLSEVLAMISDKAKIITSYPDLIQSFSGKTSKGTDIYADLWIRSELNRFKFDYRPQKNQALRGIFFLTSDLTGALTSLAEDLNTFYIYRDESEIENKKFEHGKIPLLIYISSIVFGSCQINFDKERFRVNGTWRGKTPDDWRNEMVQWGEVK